jgi:hypothetical protein
MTTLINFNPTPFANFQFNSTLDGVNYVAICTWNLYGKRYYINIYNNNGTLIVSRPIIGSPDNYDINLVFGYFQTSTLIYRESSNNFEISP